MKKLLSLVLALALALSLVAAKFRKELEAAGLCTGGVNPQSGLVEMVELADHPYFIGCQFHPEFKSRPQAAHPLFSGLIAAALAYKEAHHAETH